MRVSLVQMVEQFLGFRNPINYLFICLFIHFYNLFLKNCKITLKII